MIILSYIGLSTSNQLGIDELAKDATVKDKIDYHFNRSCVQLRNEGKRNIILKWQERWDQYQKERWTKLFFDRVNLTRVIGNFYLNQIYSGHGDFGEYQGRFFQKSATGRCSEEIETMEHLVKKCKLWSRFRVNWPNLNIVEMMQILSCRRDAVRIVEQQLTFRIEELDTV
ncbi:hypothetical protein AVEN_42892-1 [Araneus ventricosus]|uniref:Reverse transcriptase domain-containing protein n=1 Tax=Araneus ventricosus TaxID=182803 RepID=A0A4Y2AEX2_ARAVE|nr:hypothetical protein AVEN_42892-1 [Araneus ventricosus]